jgi:hypothetical protein
MILVPRKKIKAYRTMIALRFFKLFKNEKTMEACTPILKNTILYKEREK